mmetsp:Transcript_8312/g.15661  ORF Transcript_8312/g.15661 Transcript_8312/m.15661 type:complete len:1054 (+) Transcript_8312:36-3197(+)
MASIVEAYPLDDEEIEMDKAQQNDDTVNEKPTLSKSWTEQSAHAPSYSGGKVTLCHTKGTRNLYGISEDISNDEISLTPFILAPCGGDLTLIDAIHGVKARTIREGCARSSRDEEEDEDESIDTDAIVAYALAPNDYDLVTASRNNILRHYDISGSPSVSYSGTDGRGPAKVKKVLGRSGHDLPVACMEFHCSGIFFATGSVDGNVKVWDLRGGYATHSFRYHAPGYSTNMSGRGGLRGSVTCLNWCPDVTKLWLGVGRDDGSIRVHDLRIKEEEIDDVVEMTDHVGAVTCMVWANSSNKSNELDVLFTAGRDAVVNTWAIVEEERTQSGQKKKKKKEVGVDVPRTIMSYKRVHTLPVYENVEALKILPKFHLLAPGHSDRISKHDIVIATAGSKGVVRLWKTIQRSEHENVLTSIAGLEFLYEQDESSAFGEKRGGYKGLILTSPKQNLFLDRNGSASDVPLELIAVDAEHNFSFLNVSTCDEEGKTLLTSNRIIIGHNDEILDLKIIPVTEMSLTRDDYQRRVAVATNSAQVKVFDLGSYSCQVLEGHSDTVLCVDVSPCGRYLATSGKDQTMRIWHLRTGTTVAIAIGHTEGVGATAFSRKIGRFDVVGKAAKNGGGSFVVTASKDKTLKRWNLPGSTILDSIGEAGGVCDELQVFASVRAHDKDINIVSVAPNDSLVATGSQDKTVKLWNSTDLSLKGTLKGHKRGIWDCQFSMHDRVIATCSGDKTVKLWSLGDYSCVRTFQGHSSSALRVRFLSGGLQLMSCDAEGLVRLWTIRTNDCVFTMDAHEDKIWAMDIDNNMLITGGADSRLKLFRDTTVEMEQQSREEQEQIILKEQKLANHLRHNEYEQALDIALDMDKPRQVLKVLVAITENDVSNMKDAITTLQSYVKAWDTTRILQVLKYCREWNTRSRNSYISMITVKAIFTKFPADQLALVDGLAEVLSGIAPYAERHYERIDRLHSNSYLIDFALLSMGSMQSGDDDFILWEKSSKPVLPPKVIDGRVQVGGKDIVGFRADDGDSTSSSEVLTVGESDSGSDSGESSDESESD